MAARSQWSNFAIFEVTQAVVELAGDCADTFALRGYDSVQLAAAQILKAGANEVFCFASFDTRFPPPGFGSCINQVESLRLVLTESQYRDGYQSADCPCAAATGP